MMNSNFHSLFRRNCGFRIRCVSDSGKGNFQYMVTGTSSGVEVLSRQTAARPWPVLLRLLRMMTTLTCVADDLVRIMTETETEFEMGMVMVMDECIDADMYIYCMPATAIACVVFGSAVLLSTNELKIADPNATQKEDGKEYLKLDFDMTETLFSFGRI